MEEARGGEPATLMQWRTVGAGQGGRKREGSEEVIEEGEWAPTLAWDGIVGGFRGPWVVFPNTRETKV
jgi:hypothetical protein